MISFLDAVFPLLGSTVPLDHGYALFGALSRLVPQLHKAPLWSVLPIRGHASAPGVLSLTQRSRLRVRLPADVVGNLMPLVGESLELDGHTISVGAPRLFPLRPTTAMEAHLVIIKGFHDAADAFAGAVRRQLKVLPDLRQDPTGIHLEIGPRRMLRVGRHKVIGFAVMLAGLEMDASLSVLGYGLGGRHHMGAGSFFPLKW